MDLSEASHRPLCVNQCGFYGSEETKNMCSKCYNHFLKTQLINQTIEALDRLSLSDAKPSNPSVSLSILDEATNVLDSLSLLDAKPSNPSISLVPEKCFNVNSVSNRSNISALGSGSGSRLKSSRCNKCNKRFGLIGFKCRCGDLFCAKHRYATEHSCSFDYRKFDLEILIKRNHLIKADKLAQRI